MTVMLVASTFDGNQASVGCALEVEGSPLNAGQVNQVTLLVCALSPPTININPFLSLLAGRKGRSFASEQRSIEWCGCDDSVVQTPEQ